MVSLIIPWVLLLLLFVTVIMLIKKKWWLSAFLFIIITLLNYGSDCFCLGFKNSDIGDLKIFSFNVKGSGDYDANKVSSIINLLQKETPDIIFLTENFKPLKDSLHEKLHSQYPYDTQFMHHNLIYSRYPLHSTYYYKKICNGSSFMVRCNISLKDKELTLWGCHLSSNNYSKELDFLTPDKIKYLSEIKTYLSNMSDAFIQRGVEADTIIKGCSGIERVVVVGDMNDVSGALSMRKFSKAGFKDAWSVGGFGYGATIHHPLPYRIDHILYNKGLKLKGVKKIDAKGISDHDALVAIFDLE